MKQPDLFGRPDQYGGYTQPVARDTDPDTSHEAAAKITAAGKRDAHAAIVLRLIVANPKSTYLELWAAAGENDKESLGESFTIMRRIAGLESWGKVKRCGRRICRVNGLRMTTWEHVKEQAP